MRNNFVQTFIRPFPALKKLPSRLRGRRKGCLRKFSRSLWLCRIWNLRPNQPFGEKIQIFPESPTFRAIGPRKSPQAYIFGSQFSSHTTFLFFNYPDKSRGLLRPVPQPLCFYLYSYLSLLSIAPDLLVYSLFLRT